jgi:hypothetical protein
MKVLFILKRKDNFNAVTDSNIGVSTGLYNSASFVNDMLVAAGVTSNMEVVIDNNGIDAVVTKYRPTHVILEALWVVPTKFAVLCKLHPTVTWIIRLHSEMPFLAGEGMALDWLGDYASFPSIVLGANGPRMLREARFYLGHKMDWDPGEANRRIVYLPNYYPTTFVTKTYAPDKEFVDIGCFGSVRPLKNHLIQAFAAIKFAEYLGKKLRFHVNGDRLEMKGQPVMNNLYALFMQLCEKGHRLVSHSWTPRAQFLELCARMDIGMQVSFSETFNIVGADFVGQGVPFIGSKEIPWAPDEFVSDPTDSEHVFEKLVYTHINNKRNVEQHQFMLRNYVEDSRRIWREYFKG